jgi:membrane-associated phospholipid phosphatase
MAISLLVLATHWLTDVAGGTLIGLTLLALLSIPRVTHAAAKGTVKSVTSERDVGAD